MVKYYLAIDIGASSGRHIIGYEDDNHLLKIEEMYRFSNAVKKQDGHLIWDVESLLAHVIEGIKVCVKKYKKIESLSIDTWGVDYVLLNQDEEIFPVYAYRDNRCKEIIEEVHQKISFDRLYEITGSQFQEFNTIYQLYSDKKNHRLEKATDFLYIPEYLMYKLTGVKKHEYTNASTSGMLDAITNDYSKDIIQKLGFDENLFHPLDRPKTIVGPLKPEIQKIVGGKINVILCATHDTASAVEGIPMKENAPYISSGTWSLFGIKLPHALTNKQARLANYSNEYGPNYIRFQKNIMGLWIIQCLSKELNLNFVDMIELAKKSNFVAIFDVNDPCFLATPNMKREIQDYFARKKQPIPLSDQDLLNATYHSLAYSYKVAFDELEAITKQTYPALYIVGGGAKNQYLNDLTQYYCKKEVIAFPIEATAIGNLYIQMEDKA